MIWNDLVDQAFVDLQVTQVGESITTTMRTDAQNRFNELLSSLSTERLTAYNQLTGTINLSAGQVAYTVGVGGNLNTTARAQGLTFWRASYGGVLMSGGKVLSLEEFSAQTANAQPMGETAAIPKIVGADTAYPLINLRVAPPPSSAPGSLEIGYWIAVPQISDFTQAVSLPDGWPQMLHFNLAVALAPQYARQGGPTQELLANAQNSKAALVAQNQPTVATQPAQQ